jgi:hypothetical protein
MVRNAEFSFGNVLNKGKKNPIKIYKMLGVKEQLE